MREPQGVHGAARFMRADAPDAQAYRNPLAAVAALSTLTALGTLAAPAGAAQALLEAPPSSFGGVSATSTPPSALAPLQPGLDYHSFANIEQFHVTRLELELRVDFRNKVLFGAASLEVKRVDPRATQLVLDTRDLDVRDVSEKATSLLGATDKSQTTWVSRPFHLERADPVLGSPLVIELPPAAKKTSELIKIEYVTAPTAPALAWLDAGDSGAKHDPLFFTLPGPIGARNWIPLQDTPQVRFTVRAHIHTDPDQLAVMSAKNDPKAKRNGDYTFEMDEPLPPRALALAVGDLRYHELGPRSGIYAEKAFIGPAEGALADFEKLVAAGEAVSGAYPYGRADVLITPSLSPVAGVAQPRLDYLTASTLPGSALEYAARALAQGWAGNLVVPATWRDAWWSEGLSGYLAGRMVAAVGGEARAALDATLELKGLPSELAALKPEEQRLAVDLRNQDPGLAQRSARSAKARLLFVWLESRVGRERLDVFLKGFFEHFAQKSVTTEQFLDYLDRELLARSAGAVSRADIMQWVEAPGLPATAVLPDAPALAAVDAARATWLKGASAARKLDTRTWSAPEWRAFLEGMPAALRREQLAELDQAFGFGRREDAETVRDWLLLVVRNAWSPGFPRLEEYLATQGRLSLVVPLYEALMKTPAGTATAQRVYAQARTHYLAQTSAALDPIVNPAGATDDE